MAGGSTNWLAPLVPQRLADLWQRWRLRKRIAAVNEIYRQQMSVATEDQEHAIDQEWTAVVAEDMEELGVLETSVLRRLTEKFGIDIPKEAWVGSQYEHFQYIYPEAANKLRRQISEARFTYWERWARLVLPLLSLIVALVALLLRSNTPKVTVTGSLWDVALYRVWRFIVPFSF